MKKAFKRIRDEYTYLVHPKWKFILKTIAMIAFIDTFCYFVVFGSQNAIMYQDKWFFFGILMFNPFIIFMNFREAVWNGYREWKKKEITQFIPKALNYEEVFTIAQIAELLPEHNKRGFLEAIYNSKLKASIEGSKENKE